MTIWLLAMVLLASLAGLGYRQGAIRVAFSFVGILVAALLAAPLGHLLTRPIMAIGTHNPVMAWVLGPLVMFLVVSVIFKAVGFVAHRKAEFHYRYRAADLRQALWERLNRRLGLCLGLANGLVYLILLSWAIYVFSYWTVQLAAAETNPLGVRILNRLGWDLQRSGLAGAARAIDKMPPDYYELADFLGTLYRNPQSKSQLDKYPGLISLLQRQDVKDLVDDKDLNDLWSKQAPIKELLSNPKMQSLINGPEQRRIYADAVDLKDLAAFMTTGISPKYASEIILGYWDANPNASLSLIIRAGPNLSVSQMAKLRTSVAQAFLKTTLIAMPDHKVLLNAMPSLRAVADGEGGSGMSAKSIEGAWNRTDGKYEINFSESDQPLTGTLEGDQLVIKGAMALVFDKEN